MLAKVLCGFIFGKSIPVGEQFRLVGVVSGRHAITKLRTDNNKLKEELLLENKFSVQPANAAAAIQICKLQDEADMYTRKVVCLRCAFHDHRGSGPLTGL